jgi:hypothetical protein
VSSKASITSTFAGGLRDTQSWAQEMDVQQRLYWTLNSPHKMTQSMVTVLEDAGGFCRSWKALRPSHHYAEPDYEFLRRLCPATPH